MAKQMEESIECYVSAERSVEEAMQRMANQRELKKRAVREEINTLECYVTEERITKDASKRMTKQIELGKRELTEKKERGGTETINYYVAEKRVMEEGSKRMARQLEQKRGLSGERARMEVEAMQSYETEEKTAYGVSKGIEKQIELRKRELTEKKAKQEVEGIACFVAEDQIEDEVSRRARLRELRKKAFLEQEALIEVERMIRPRRRGNFDEEQVAEEERRSRVNQRESRRRNREIEKAMKANGGKGDEEIVNARMEEKIDCISTSIINTSPVPTFTIHVSTLRKGELLTLWLRNQASVQHLFETVSEEEVIPLDELHLEFEGKRLIPSSEPLSNYNIFKDSVVRMVLISKSQGSWKSWHKKQLISWNAFELKHFTVGRYFMEKWNLDHREICKMALEKEMELISGRSHLSPFNPTFLSEDTSVTIHLLPKPTKNRCTVQDYNTYLARDETQMRHPSYYFDVAENLFSSGQDTLALRVLSNLAEIDLENPQFLRLLAFKLIEQGDAFSLHSIRILERVKKLRPEEPQSLYQLTLVLINNANKILRCHYNQTDMCGLVPNTLGDEEQDFKKIALEGYSKALQLLNEIIIGKWDVRFAQVEATAIMDLNRLVQYIYFYDYHHLFLHAVDNRFLLPVRIDLRVVVFWDTDMTDVELHVEEPSGEKCYSFHNKTKNGGFLSRDFTGGYGPEEYMIRKAPHGKFSISVCLFSSMAKYTGTTVLVKIFTHFGSPKEEKEENYSLRLYKDREICTVATVTF
eukprot:TRINITY_DN24697_c0_g1_i1.p1 TRINITY_DN24697_c0_g1~~TRINITY_DN24697_c0_g1_i1.p1  ORF type:complete len:756 (-),score=204.11 TRINITY_DN24697_c0_g1_i1:45-2312(-)